MDGHAGTLQFSTLTLAELDGAEAQRLDALSFGVVGIDRTGLVEVYSATEARLAGLMAETVMGRHFFHAVAPCMNNSLVAQRFENEPKLDAIIDYVLTFRMRPTPVKIRLLQSPDVARRYLLIHR